MTENVHIQLTNGGVINIEFGEDAIALLRQTLADRSVRYIDVPRGDGHCTLLNVEHIVRIDLP